MIINKVCYVCFAFFLVLGTFCDVRSLAKGATRTIRGASKGGGPGLEKAWLQWAVFFCASIAKAYARRRKYLVLCSDHFEPPIFV